MIGELNTTKEGCVIEIINHKSWDNVTVLFHETNNTSNCSYQAFKNGTIKNRMKKSVNNVACIGNTKTWCNGKFKNSYSTWSRMIDRCYNEKIIKSYKSYRDCFVCDEWLCFENFEKWYDDNFYTIKNERMCLDKDILIKNNKIYSPETCCFVPTYINTLIINAKESRGNLPVGVALVKGSSNRYYSYISKKGKQKKLCYSNTKEDAFNKYKEEKERYIKTVANSYKNFIPKKLYDAMYNYKIDIND
jgi:hypothetical protein